MSHELSPSELAEYRERGFLVKSAVFDPAEVKALSAAAEELYRIESPARTVERDGVTVRAVHGCHETHDTFGALTHDPRMLLPARQIIEGDAYIHQSKINAKRAFAGDQWEWHQDFTFWQLEDGMRAPDATNVAVLLDDSTEFNGPLLVIPGSHRRGRINTHKRSDKSGSEGWEAHLAADLEYTIKPTDLIDLVQSEGIVSTRGVAGSLLFFDPQICHGSGVNMSPIDRRIALFTYNKVDNLPVTPGAGRPEFLASRKAQALETVPWAA